MSLRIVDGVVVDGNSDEDTTPNTHDYERNIQEQCLSFLPPGAEPQFLQIVSHLHIFRQVLTAEPMYDVILEYIRNGIVHNYEIRPLAILHTVRKKERPWPPDSRRTLLWHGTKPENVAGILENGFKLPEPNEHNMLGVAIYLADRVTKSAHYCFDKNQCLPGATGYIFLCEAALGKSCSVKRPHKDLKQAPEAKDVVGRLVRSDSVVCEGQYVPRENKKVDGIIVPSGFTVENVQKRGFGVLYNEYAVYDVEKVRPRYLIKFVVAPISQ